MTISICGRQRVTHACAIATVLGVSMVPATVWGQSLEYMAVGVEFYYQSKDRCAYADGVDALVDAVDAYMRSRSPYRWEATRKKVAIEIPVAVNIRKLENQSANAVVSDEQVFCDVMAYPVGQIVGLSELIVGPGVKGLEDKKRLSKSQGQPKEAED